MAMFSISTCVDQHVMSNLISRAGLGRRKKNKRESLPSASYQNHDKDDKEERVGIWSLRSPKRCVYLTWWSGSRVSNLFRSQASGKTPRAKRQANKPVGCRCTLFYKILCRLIFSLLPCPACVDVAYPEVTTKAF